MDDTIRSSTISPSHSIPDESEVAFAAEAAAQAVEEADAATARCQQQQQFASKILEPPSSMLVCRICGRGVDEGRPIIRFSPMNRDPVVTVFAPNVLTFTEDISLHVFCGKTATILPNINQPDLEILSKAGLKNKHGIGPEVNAALARTRCAVLHEEGAKEKQFYLVKEFEANLQCVRSANIGVGPFNPFAAFQDIPNFEPHHRHQQQLHQLPYPHPDHSHLRMNPQTHVYAQMTSSMPTTMDHKIGPPARAAAGQLHKPGRRYDNIVSYPTNNSFTMDGKVRCGCGGLHLPPGTPSGNNSFRSHVMSKKHRDWLENNGMLSTL